MIAFDEDALICDLAETYGIMEYRQLPAWKVAVFSVGLRDDSRIKMALSGSQISLDRQLLAGAVDRLSLLLWAKTADGQKGVNRPSLIADQLSGYEKASKRQELVFDSGEDFERAREALLEQMGGES